MNTHSSLESLEARIAPAFIVVNAATKTATWTDHDGDAATLKWTTNPPTFMTTDQGAGLRVDAINLTLANNANEAFTLTVKTVPGSDGHINLGRISAAGVPLKSWSSPAASLLEIDCSGIGSLTVGSMGTLPISAFTGSGANGASIIDGMVSTVLIKGDIGAGALLISNGGFVKSVTVTGSLRGTDDPGAGFQSGILSVQGNSIDSVTIGGSIIGGDDQGDGQLLLGLTNKLTIKGSVRGGSASDTGFLSGNAKTISIGGDVVGGSAANAGRLSLVDIKTLTIGGSILGGSVQTTGIVSMSSAGSITVKGSIVGSFKSAATAAGSSGGIYATGNVGSIKIGGDLVAGTFGTGTQLEYNGWVSVDGNLGSIAITGNLLGNNNTNAIVIAQGVAPAKPGNYNAIGKVTVGGTVAYGYIASGHAKDLSGAYGDRVHTAENPDAGIGSVTVGGDWFHSNLTAGVNDSGSIGFSSADTHSVGDAARLAVIGPVVIKGYMLDNPSAQGFSGIGADKIASIVAHGAKLFKTGNAARSLDASGFVDVMEFA